MQEHTRGGIFTATTHNLNGISLQNWCSLTNKGMSMGPHSFLFLFKIVSRTLVEG